VVRPLAGPALRRQVTNNVPLTDGHRGRFEVRSCPDHNPRVVSSIWQSSTEVPTEAGLIAVKRAPHSVSLIAVMAS
jgi:hypothetical protein